MLTKLSKIIILSILSCLAMNGQDIRNAFLKKYSKLNSISLKFTVDNNFDLFSMKAKKGNKFILEQKSVIIFCDGTTVWNVNKVTNKCMISNRDIHNETTSIDDIFLGILNTYIIEKTMTVNDSKLGSNYYIVMKPRNKDNVINGIESLTMIVDKKTLQIKTIEYADNNDTRSITIKSMKLNQKIDNSAFVFTPSKDMTVIDLR